MSVAKGWFARDTVGRCCASRKGLTNEPGNPVGVENRSGLIGWVHGGMRVAMITFEVEDGHGEVLARWSVPVCVRGAPETPRPMTSGYLATATRR